MTKGATPADAGISFVHIIMVWANEGAILRPKSSSNRLPFLDFILSSAALRAVWYSVRSARGAAAVGEDPEMASNDAMIFR